jgi:hypothetical protein
MTTYTISEYDMMDDDQFLLKNREDCELELSSELKAEMVQALDAWALKRGDEAFADSLSNAYLYEDLRMNGIAFGRLRSYTLAEIDAVDEEVFWHMHQSGKFKIDITEEQRAVMVSAREDWLEDLETREAFGPAEEYSNEELYNELRINEVPFEREPSAAPSYA